MSVFSEKLRFGSSQWYRQLSALYCDLLKAKVKTNNNAVGSICHRTYCIGSAGTALCLVKLSPIPVD